MKLSVDKQELKTICDNNDIEYMALFGSYARGDEKADSDVDLLVRYSSRKSLFDEVDVEDNLQEFFGKRVDIVTERGLHPYIKPYVLKDLIILYERQ